MLLITITSTNQSFSTSLFCVKEHHIPNVSILFVCLWESLRSWPEGAIKVETWKQIYVCFGWDLNPVPLAATRPSHTSRDTWAID